MNAVHKYPIYVSPHQLQLWINLTESLSGFLGGILEGLGSPHEFPKYAINSHWFQRTKIISLTSPPAGCLSKLFVFCVLEITGCLLCSPFSHSDPSIQRMLWSNHKEAPHLLSKLLSTKLHGDFIERSTDIQFELLCVCRYMCMHMCAYVEAGIHPSLPFLRRHPPCVLRQGSSLSWSSQLL